MSLELFGTLVLLLIGAGFFWHRKNVQLASALFCEDYRLRYVQGRWVLTGELAGQRIRYATGGMGFFPALSYLLLETPVDMAFTVKAGGNEAVPDCHTGADCAEVIESLRRRDGFRRLDALQSGAAPIAATGRVNWLHAGEGLLLRRYTRLGGDAEFIREDVGLLRTLASATSP